jgi:hypothetical protein
MLTCFSVSLDLHPLYWLTERVTSMFRFIGTLGLFALIAGCSRSTPPAVPASDHSDPHAQHTQHDTASAKPADIVFRDGTPSPDASQPFTLRFHLEESGRPVANLEPTHEKRMHLIIVRDALDVFLHLHPEIAADGTATVELTLPTAGSYHVYVDYKPAGGSPATAKATLATRDAVEAKPELVVNAPGIVSTTDLTAELAITPTSSGESRTVTFRLKDRVSGEAVQDLQPYLGAMGHLVVIRAATNDYIHAHPESSSNQPHEVSFEVHAAAAGLYAGWGQFQRAGKIMTVPFVFEVK